MQLKGDAMAQNAARGSSAFTDNVRWQMNMASMDKEQAKRYGLTRERGQYVQVSIPKNNYAPPFGELWLKRGKGGFLQAVELKRTREAREEDILSASIELIEKHQEQGRYFSIRRFVESYGGQHNELGCGVRQMRSILNKAIAEEKLFEIEPPHPMRNVTAVLSTRKQEVDCGADNS